MNELSLFSGAGGGLLGTKLLGFRHIGYVEKDEGCQKIIAQRIRDGILDYAPIYCDIKTFIDSGRCSLFEGVTNIITGGFPCQPFSIAGKGLGESDARNMWPSTIECIRRIRPQYCLLENVPGLLIHPYFGTILWDLAQSGYTFRWTTSGIGELGGYTLRRRLWIVARLSPFVIGRNKKEKDIQQIIAEIKLRFANKFSRVSDIERNWKDAEYGVFGVDNGMAYEVDRVRAIGNGQNPRVVKTVWELLNRSIERM